MAKTVVSTENRRFVSHIYIYTSTHTFYNFMNDFKKFFGKICTWYDESVWSGFVNYHIYQKKGDFKTTQMWQPFRSIWLCLHNINLQQFPIDNRVPSHGTFRAGTTREWPDLVLQNRNDDYVLRQIMYSITRANMISWKYFIVKITSTKTSTVQFS